MADLNNRLLMKALLKMIKQAKNSNVNDVTDDGCAVIYNHKRYDFDPQKVKPIMDSLSDCGLDLVIDIIGGE